MKTITGTVSHGTMRPEDLIPKFIDTIQKILDKDMSHNLWMSLITLQNRMIDDPDYFGSETCQDDLTYLFDILNSLAPEGYYFGSHPGDGSDYGFWQCEEEF